MDAMISGAEILLGWETRKLKKPSVSEMAEIRKEQ